MKAKSRSTDLLSMVFSIGVILVWPTMTASAADPADLKALDEEGGRNYSTKEGREYFEKFQESIDPVFVKALRDCGSTSPDTEEPVTFAFVVGADGAVKRLVYSSDVPFGRCVGSKLEAIKTVPPPPHDNWVVTLGAANHQKQQGPPDRPIPLTGQQVREMQKAIAPYVAEARATYPAARKRFLEGLPSGSAFYVRVPLTDKEGKREDTFVAVQSIHDGQISGTIDSDLNLITEFKRGDRITFPESKIDNWVIVRPDGTEEGNAVGNFLDTYKPK